MSESAKQKDDAAAAEAAKAAEEAAAAKAAKKARKGTDTPDPSPAPWQLPDYAGPLDCEQAAWRNAQGWRSPATK